MDFLNNTSTSNPYSAEFTPQAIEANATNPTSNATGGTNSSGYFNFSLTGTQNTNPQGQSLMANGQQQGLTPQQYSPQVGVQNSNQSQGGSSSPLNSNALSLFSQAAQHSGVGKSVMGGITNSINDFGTNLGFAANSADTAANLAAFDVAPGASTEAAANIADSVGTFGAGSSDLGASTFGGTLSGTLGAAGLGYLGGGILAHALGENSTGGSIGGALGAAAGYALGGAGAAALGLELGAFAGPVGAIVGGIGGAIFGGLFGGGGSPPTSDSGEASGITASGGLINPVTGGKNSTPGTNSLVATANNNFSNLAQQASTALGIQFNTSLDFNAQDSTRHGGAWIAVQPHTGTAADGSGQISLAQGDAAQNKQAYLQALTSAAQQSGASADQISQLQTWYTQNYVNSNNGASNQPPTLPNNPKGNSDQQAFQKFLSDYQAKQTAGAAPVQTTVGTNNGSTPTK